VRGKSAGGGQADITQAKYTNRMIGGNENLREIDPANYPII
jgi:hypothetical protein